MNQDIESEDKFDRKFSCFFAREFFWHFLEERLDKRRAAQVAEHLATCAECKILLERIKVSKKILLELGQTQPTPEAIEYVKKEHHFWEEFFERIGLTQSLSTMKWVVQLCLVGLALVLTVHAFPWLNLARSLKKMRPASARMAEQKNAENLAQDDVHEASDGEVIPLNQTSTRPGPQASPVFIGPVALSQPPIDLKPLAVPGKQTIPNALPSENPTETDAESMAKVAPARLPLTPSLPSSEEKETNEDQFGDETASLGPGKATDGFVYRGSLKVEELSDDLADKVTKQISDLGGKKAGQVELGWHRGRQRYYHFIIPEENYEKLLSDLNTEGFVQLVRERHPRVIKKGYNRVILTIEQEE